MEPTSWWARGATTAVVAVLVVGLLTTGIVVAAVVPQRSASSGSLATSPKVHLSQLPGSEGLVEAGEPAPPSATGSGEASASAPPLPGHRTPGAVVVPFRAGRTEWSGASNGISLRLVMTTPSPRAGEPVTFLAEASKAGALCCNLTLEFGDGSAGAYPPAPGLGEENRCSSREPKSDSVRGEIRHVYNRAGRWNFRLSARSGGICGPSEVVYGSLEGTLQVTGGSSSPSPQGAALPSVRPASIAPYEPLVITLSAEARDDDGYIDRLIIDWGDGSATETYTNPRPCQRTAGGWPAGTYTILPLWMGVGPVRHRYSDDRPHRVTVTAVSTGCDRTGEQRVSGALTFPEPLPPPPPIESIPLPPPSQVPPPPPIGSLPVAPPGPPPTLQVDPGAASSS